MTAPTEARRRSAHDREHRRCFACGPEHPHGLGLRFQLDPATGAVRANWSCPDHFCSYPGTVHGGLIATLLDSAMVHALFARNLSARTAALQIRYLRPVTPATPLALTAQLLRHCGRLWVVAAELTQHDRLCARAEARFMQLPS